MARDADDRPRKESYEGNHVDERDRGEPDDEGPHRLQTGRRPHTSPFEYVLLFVVVLLIAIGAFVAARPLLQEGPDGKRRLYVTNAILAAVPGIVFVALSVGLASDIYRCDVLGIPNCD